MMQNKERQKEITQVVSRDENTPELAQFWGKKYLEILDKGLFVLDSRFVEIFNDEQISSFVPAGHLSLCSHLDKENRLDEDLLVGTVETSIRLLDAIVNYLWKQKNIIEVGQNRVISLGLDDVDEFFERYNDKATDDDREYIAQLVGETAYRASEFIAEEKGPFDSYDEVKYDIKNNYFDTWVDEKDNIKSNQEIQKLKNEVQAGKYSLLPRRNLAILNFATEKNWSKYSDSETIGALSRALKKPTEPKEAANKPFNIKLNTENSEVAAKNKINNHVGEIFEHLLKERHGQETAPEAKPAVKELEPKSEPESETPIEKQDNDQSFAKDIRLYILINNNKKTVFAKHNNRLTLPFVSLDDNNNNLEKAIWEGVLKKYNLLINIDREFTVLYDPLKHKEVINIGYLADLQNDTLPPDLFWAAPENEDFIDEVSYKLLTRYKSQSRVLETESIPQSPSLQSPQIARVSQENIYQSEDLKAVASAPLINKLETLNQQSSVKKTSFKKPSQPKLLYSLKLEQNIKTKTFGAVQIIFEYTKKFPQIEDFRCDVLAVGDKHALDVIINLINLLLTNNYSLENIEKYLEEKITKDETNNINNFITVFIFAMREVPSDLNELIELLSA
jgi:Ribonucleotide reductase, barrel domain